MTKIRGLPACLHQSLVAVGDEEYLLHYCLLDHMYCNSKDRRTVKVDGRSYFRCKRVDYSEYDKLKARVKANLLKGLKRVRDEKGRKS